MQIVTWITSQLLSYSMLVWIAFVIVAFCAARYGGWWIVPIGHFVIAAAALALDFRWVREAMNSPNWDGAPDMDVIFIFGVLLRVLLINAVLIPVTAFGLHLRRKRVRLIQDVQTT